MEVKFLKDFRGKLTGEVFYPAGSVGAVRDIAGAQLIEMGIAELFEPVMPVQVEAEILPPEIGAPVEVEEEDEPKEKRSAKPKAKK